MEQNDQRWNVYSLKEYFDLAMKNTIEVIEKVEKINDEKHKSMNEIRSQLDRQAETFTTRADLKLVEQKVEGLSKLVYAGLGIWFVLQGIMVFILIEVFKR
jgi:hypothetical protein